MDPLLLPGGFCVWFSDPRGPATLIRSQPGPHDDTTLLRPQRGGVLAQRGGVLPQRGAALAQIREVVFWPRRWCSSSERACSDWQGLLWNVCVLCERMAADCALFILPLGVGTKPVGAEANTQLPLLQ